MWPDCLFPNIAYDLRRVAHLKLKYQTSTVTPNGAERSISSPKTILPRAFGHGAAILRRAILFLTSFP